MPAIYVLFRDESDKMAMIEELRRFAQGFEMISDTLVLADKDFNTIYINPTGLERSGYDLKEVLGKPTAMFSSTEEGDIDPLELIQELFENGFWTGERTAVTKDGRKYPVDLAVTMTVDRKGDPEMIAAVSRDITERKEAERTLLQARERAEFFTDLMAHDINNYIQGVIGFLDLMGRTTLTDEQREHMDRAMEQATRVSDLIGRVREISKAQHPQEVSPIDLIAVIDEVVTDLQDRYSDRPLKVNISSPGGSVTVMADDLLRELVMNIIDNAIKYCVQDEVVVDVKVIRTRRERAHKVLMSIADRGPGVPDGDKDSIFFRFVRMIEEAEGSGLGLSLVMALSDRYGGRVWVEDRVPGKQEEGSIFFVELPPG
jgi:PAS domain S-box-containing protein